MRGRAAIAVVGGALATACSFMTSFDDLSTSDPPDASVVLPDEPDATTPPPVDAGTTRDGGDAASPSSAYRTLIVGDTPLVYYRLGDTSTTTAKDEMGNHDGLYVGTSVRGAGAIAGDPDKAFFGSGQGWIDVGEVYPFAGSVPYSIEAWVSPTASATLTAVLGRNVAPNPGSTPTNGYSLSLDEGTLKPVLGRWAGGLYDPAEAPALAPGVFSHVVGTFDGTTQRVYVNGALGAAVTAPRPITAAVARLSIAATRSGLHGFFIGSLDEVALYDKPLTQAQVTAHYEAGRGK